MSHIILDVAFDTETVEEVLTEIAAECSITFEIVNENGAAGGWPEVKFEGTKENLTNLIRSHYTSGDDEQDNWLIDCIEE